MLCHGKSNLVMVWTAREHAVAKGGEARGRADVQLGDALAVTERQVLYAKDRVREAEFIERAAPTERFTADALQAWWELQGRDVAAVRERPQVNAGETRNVREMYSPEASAVAECVLACFGKKKREAILSHSAIRAGDTRAECGLKGMLVLGQCMCWFHHSLGSGPMVLPVCYGCCVGGVHSLVHAGNAHWPKQGHACIADQNWYCPGCVAGAGRSENIRAKSKDVECCI